MALKLPGLVRVYNTLRHGMAYRDPGADHYEEQYRSRVLANLKPLLFLRKAAVDSTDGGNMMRIMFLRRICNGANGPPWLVAAAEARAVGTMESRPIAERYWA